MTTFEKVKQIIMDHLSVEEDDVTMDSKFVDDLGADSLDEIELVMEFEEQFNIQIPDCDTGAGKTVRDAVEYIDKEING